MRCCLFTFLLSNLGLRFGIIKQNKNSVTHFRLRWNIYDCNCNRRASSIKHWLNKSDSFEWMRLLELSQKETMPMTLASTSNSSIESEFISATSIVNPKLFRFALCHFQRNFILISISYLHYCHKFMMVQRSSSLNSISMKWAARWTYRNKNELSPSLCLSFYAARAFINIILAL